MRATVCGATCLPGGTAAGGSRSIPTFRSVTFKSRIATMKEAFSSLGSFGDVLRVLMGLPPELAAYMQAQPQGFSVSLTVENPADAERKFKALSEGGSVNMPFGKTFFAKGFGMCVD